MTHMRTHSGEKLSRFGAGKGFKRKAYLTRHLRTHTCGRAGFGTFWVSRKDHTNDNKYQHEMMEK